MNRLPFESMRVAARSDRGSALVNLLVGLGVSILVIGGFAVAVFGLMKPAQDQTDSMKKQASAEQVLNRIARDVQESADILVADSAELIVKKRDSAADTGGANPPATLVRYALQSSGELTVQEQGNFSGDYDYSNPTQWDRVRVQVLAEDVHEGAIFMYFDKAGNVFAEESLPALGTGAAKNIVRVRIWFAAGVGENNTIEMETQVAVKSRVGSGAPMVDPPACPIATISDSYNTEYPELSWGVTGGTASFLITRDGVPLTTIDATDGQVDFAHTDLTLADDWIQIVHYKVLASGPGGISTDCGDLIWIPRLRTPVLEGAVTPAVTSSDAWPAAESEPTVTLRWGTIRKATSYTIYRRTLDPRTGGIKQADENVGTVTGLSWSTNEPFSSMFEYYVVAKNTLQTSDGSNAVRLLTHPTPVEVEGVATTYFQNRLTWAPDDSDATYRVMRRLAGTSSWTQVGPALPRTTTTYTDVLPGSMSNQAELGSRYEYRIEVTNRGPRGGASDETFATRRGTTASVLQFPADPAWTGTQTGVGVAAVGTEGGSSDGVNRISWSAVKSASSYSVARMWLSRNSIGEAECGISGAGSRNFRVGGGGSVSLCAAETTATSFADTNAGRGNRHFYSVIATNATGASPNAAGATSPDADVAYQRPVAPSIQHGNDVPAPTDRVSQVAYNLAWNPTGDTGMPAGLGFCGESGGSGCSYALSVNGRSMPVEASANTFVYTRGFGASFGATDNWRVQACNPGGCSDAGSFTAETWPGPFNAKQAQFMRADGIDEHSETRTHHWYHAGAISSNGQGLVNVVWNASEGANYYTWSRSVDADDASADNGVASNFGLGSTSGTYATETGMRPATPGYRYDYRIVAYAPNGKSRIIEDAPFGQPLMTPGIVKMQMKPAIVGFTQLGPFCNPAQTGWMPGYQLYRGAVSYGSPVRVGRLHVAYWAGNVNSFDVANKGTGAAESWIRSAPLMELLNGSNPSSGQGGLDVRYRSDSTTSNILIDNKRTNAIGQAAGIAVVNVIDNLPFDIGATASTPQANTVIKTETGAYVGNCGSGDSWRPSDRNVTGAALAKIRKTYDRITSFGMPGNLATDPSNSGWDVSE